MRKNEIKTRQMNKKEDDNRKDKGQGKKAIKEKNEKKIQRNKGKRGKKKTEGKISNRG